MSKSKPIGNRVSAWLLAAAILLAMLPMPVYAASGTDSGALIESGVTEWKYTDDNTNPAGDNTNQQLWTLESFDDSQWKTGSGSFGAKRGAQSAVGSYVPDVLLTQYIDGTSTDIPAYFFRSTFDLGNVDTVEALQGSVLYDDAVIIYINGVRAAAFDADDITGNMQYGGSNDGDPRTGNIDISGDLLASLNLKASGNTIAVELHQGREESSDIFFDMEKLELGVPAPAELRDIILNMGEDDSQRYVTWLSSSGADECVQLIKASQLSGGAMPAQGFTTVSARKAVNTAGDTGFSNYRVTLDNLESNTEYAYRVGSEGLWSSVYKFKTGEVGDGSFSFLFAGDPQIGSSGSVDNDYAGWAATLNKAENWFPEAEFLISAGDQVENSSTEYQYFGYTLPTQMKTLTQAVNVGNHDNGSNAYSEHYTTPNTDSGTASAGEYGGDYWFSYDGALIMSINSNNMSTATHKAFLTNAISDYTNTYGEPTWKIVTFHHSVYSTASHTQNGDILARRAELPVEFSKLGIDAVLMGHDHVYTRSYMMDGTTPIDNAAYYTASGTNTYASFADPAEGLVFYLTANSASGSKHYAIQNLEFPFMAVDNQENVPNITKVDVTDGSLTFTTYRTDDGNTENDVVDSFSITKSTDGADHAKPILTVPGDVSFVAGSDEAKAFDPMAGVSAKDNVDGEIAANKITVNSSLDINTPDEYTLTYSVADAAGNLATATRKVTITRAIDVQTIVTSGTTTWKYLDDNTDPADGEGLVGKTAWTTTDFDDSQWKSAAGSFGAKKDALAAMGDYTPTVLLTHHIPEGQDNAGDTIPAYFFRTSFDLENPDSIGAIRGSIAYDDGAIVYINGVRVASFDADGITGNMQYGGSGAGDPKTGEISISGVLLENLNLKATGNVIAVELHQVSSTSSDIYFDIPSLTADDSDKTGTAATIKDIVLSVGDSSATRYVTWQSNSNATETIQLCYASDVVNGEFPANPRFDVASIAVPNSSGNGFWNYHVGLGNIFKNGQSYAYRVGSNQTGWSDIYYTDSPKADSDGSFSFLFAGDPQIGSGSVTPDTEGWCTTLEKAKSWFADDAEFLISAGDQVNTNNSDAEYDGFLTPDWLRTLPLATNVGNHDSGSGYYSEHFGAPGNVDASTATSTGTYGGDYWFDYDGTLIMSLNSNDTSTAKHKAFMESAIANYTATYGEPNWKIVTFHHSVYSTANHTYDSGIITRREELPVVFSELGINAVLMGHDHVYTRTYMMDGTVPITDEDYYTQVGADVYGGVTDPDNGAVFYLTANSASGSKFYTNKNTGLYFSAVDNQESVPNLTKVDVTDSSITFTTYRTGESNTEDDVLDSFTITRTGTAQTDKLKPALTVPADTTITVGDAFDPMEGVSAVDRVDGTLTSSVTVSGSVNTNKAGEYTLTYSVTDAAGNTATAKRVITVSLPRVSTTVVSTAETSWKYLDDNTNPAGDDANQQLWALAAYDDSAWKTAKGSFGAKNGSIQEGVHDGYTPNTLLTQYIPDGQDGAGDDIPAYFFRTSFDLTDLDSVVAINGLLRYDDGANVYINGVKVAACNTTGVTGNTSYNNGSSSDAQEGGFSLEGAAFKALNLKATGNILAVELHNDRPSSSDIFLDFVSLDVLTVDKSDSSSGDSSFPSTGSNTTTTTVTKPDGSIVTTVTDKASGSVTETTKQPNGVTGTTVKDKNGNVTNISATLPDTVSTGVVTLPVSVQAGSNGASTIKVSVGGKGATVEIPVANVGPGTVAVLVNADGSQTIIKTSVVTKTGIVLHLDGTATIKIINNAKNFSDVAAGYWGKAAVDFVSARELFMGVSENVFAPDGEMTRNMLMTVLARLDGVDTGANAFEVGMNWAVTNGISDGSSPNGTISREQLACMLYRYAQKLGCDMSAAGSLAEFTDAENVSDYARQAIAWAVGSGIINGTTQHTLSPQGNATRGQVSTMLMRFCENLVF